MKTKYLTVISCILILTLLASCAIGAAGGASAEVQTETQAPEAQGSIVMTEQPPRPVRPVRSTANPARMTSIGLEAGSHGYIAMRHILFMNDNLYGRTSFSYRELEAAQWIVQQLLEMGYTQDAIQVQQFSWEDVYEWAWDTWEVVEEWRDFFREFPARQGRLSQNVILTVPGRSEQVIVVGAHYDSFPYPGASDNASGVALLLESAERMLEQDNYYTIVYAFFGAEEVGIVGAYFYLDSLTDEELDRIVLMVNADVLFEGPYPLYAAGYKLGEIPQAVPQANTITRRIDAIADDVHRIYGIEIEPFPNGIFWTTDHLPFLEAGYTVVVFAGLTEADGWLSPRVLHTPMDCIHYINYRWPGKAEHAMRAYSIFLERILLASYS